MYMTGHAPEDGDGEVRMEDYNKTTTSAGMPERPTATDVLGIGARDAEITRLRGALDALLAEGLRWVHDPAEAPAYHQGGVCTWCAAVEGAREALEGRR